MALGKNAIYVAVVEGKGTLWNLGSNYNGLADDILKKDATIKVYEIASRKLEIIGLTFSGFGFELGGYVVAYCGLG